MMTVSEVIPIAKLAADIPLVTRIQELNLLGQELERSGRRLISLTAGEPDFDTPEHIKRAVAIAIDDGYTHYTSNRGIPELREAIATKLANENGIQADPKSQIMVTNGGAQALFLSLQATLNPGDEILLQDPSYGPYATTARLLGIVPVFAESSKSPRPFRPDLDAMEAAVTGRTRALVINSPGNPTGVVYTRPELEAVGDFACRHNLTIITDEVYEKIVYDGNTHESIAALGPEIAARTITVNSLSKTYAMTGWRLAYLAAPAHVVDVVAMIQQNSGRMASAFVQKAAVTALLGPQGAVLMMAREYSSRRELVMSAIGGIKGLSSTAPEGAFYAFVDVSELGLDGLEFARHLLSHGGVAVTPGDFFGPAGRDCVRLSFAKKPEELSVAMRAVSAAVNDLRERTQ
jgi:aspartate aminotransferase